MNSRTKNFLKWAVTAVASLVILLVSAMKLVAAAPLVEIYSKLGLLPYMQSLGFALFVFLGLFIWPRTQKIGFLLLTAYFGGAMAVELSHDSIFLAPAVILSLVWLATYLRDPSVFKSTIPAKQTAPSI